MSERVVNIRDFRVLTCVVSTDVKIGRWWYRLPPDVARVDRGTPWGNPYRIGVPWCADAPRDSRDGWPMTREDAIGRYRSSLEVGLAGNPAFLEPLRGKRLACWCYPLPCHGDVIVELSPETRS